MKERRPSFKEVRRPAHTFPPQELAFSAVLERMKKPQDFDPKWWKDSISVLGMIQGKMGKPLEVITDSPVGRNIPSTYQLENGVIRFMPQWRYVSVENNGRSTLVYIDPKRSETDKHAQSFESAMQRVSDIKDPREREERERAVRILDLSMRIEDALNAFVPSGNN